jgi:SagB-type dehydrogenase family enzyme
MKSLIRKTRFEVQRDPADAWKLFHENSKIERNRPITSNEIVVQKMTEQRDTIDYHSFPSVTLEGGHPIPVTDLAQSIQSRVSAHDWQITSMTLAELDTLLHLAYGVTRSNEGTQYVRPFRACPSGGGLYPLEIYISARNVDGLEAGLYHFNPRRQLLELIREGDQAFNLSPAFVQRDVIEGAACVWLIAAIFERTVFKYGNRGYRFALIESGHLAQNANLAATALGLGVLNMGGFFDRDVDEFLGFDGLNQSTIYSIAFGRKGGA